jgi:hypothetical protein
MTTIPHHAKELAPEIEALGGRIDSLRVGRHLRLRWSIGEAKWIETIAVSPSDFRARRNALAQIRRRARQK